MLKRLFGVLLTCSIILSGCTSSANATPKSKPLDLPVAKVSAEYSEDAMKILKSFYDVNVKELVSEEVLNAPVMMPKFNDNGKVIEEIEYQVVDGWYYENYGLDFYTYTGDLNSYDRNSHNVLGNLFADGYKDTKKFYTDINFYVLLSKDGNIVGQGYYGGGVGRTAIEGGSFDFYPQTFLFLDDEFMKALKEEGFDTSTTIAKCATINPYCNGFYFSDGKIERYYPIGTLMRGMEEVVELNKFYTPIEVYDIIEKSFEVSKKFWSLDKIAK